MPRKRDVNYAEKQRNINSHKSGSEEAIHMGSREAKFEHRCRECLKPSAVVRKDPKAVCTRCQGKAGRNKKRLDRVAAGKAGFEAVIDSHGKKSMVQRVVVAS